MLRLLAPQLDLQLAVDAPHGEHLLVERDPRLAFVERPRVRDVVEAADLDREHALGRDDLEVGAGAGDQLRRRERRVRAVVVEEQHVAARRCIARQHVPAGDDEILAGLQFGQLRLTAGGDDHDVGVQ